MQHASKGINTMSNDLTAPPEDDGYDGSIQSGRLIKGTFARWTDSAGWHDRDGMALPSPMLAISVIECLQRWSNKKPDTITEKPLPDPEVLNATIPQSEWERDLNGQPRPPWAHAVGVYLVDPAGGGICTYLNSTTGAHMAVDALREATVVVRTLRGARVAPLVNLASRPFKTSFGMRTRPYFEIIDWRLLGSGGALSPPTTPPQIAGPTTASATAKPTPGTPTPPTTPAASPSPPKTTKPALRVGAETVASMEPVAPITCGELLDDEIPW
jgi:hypothetical protein